MSLKKMMFPDRPSAAVQRAAAAHGLALYYIKYMGAMDVADTKGSELADNAMKQVLEQCKLYKKNGWKAPKTELSVTNLGVKLTDRNTGKIFLDIPLRQVSYCQDERTDNCYFVFIARETPDAGPKCFVFKSDYQAAEIMTALGAAFAKAAVSAGVAGIPRSPQTARAGAGWTGGQAPNEVEALRRKLEEQEYENQRLRAKMMSQNQSQSSYGPKGGAQPARSGFDSDFNPSSNAYGARPAGASSYSVAKADPFGGFGDSFAATPNAAAPTPAQAAFIPAAPAARAPNKRNENNPYARQRGAPPPAELAPVSQIKVPQARPTLRPAPASTSSSQSASTPTTSNPPDAPTSSVRRGLPTGALLNEFEDVDEDKDEASPSPSPAPAKASTPPLPEPLDDLDNIDDLMNELAAEAEKTNGAADANDDDKEEEASPTHSYKMDAVQHTESHHETHEATHSVAHHIEQSSHTETNGTHTETHSETHTADTQAVEAAPEATEGEGATPAGEWRGSEFVELVPLCHHVWSMATADENGRVDGGQLRPLMLMSGLDMDALAVIWGMVDTEQMGSVDYKEFAFLMGLMAQAQRGEELNTAIIGPHSPSPHLEGLQAIPS